MVGVGHAMVEVRSVETAGILGTAEKMFDYRYFCWSRFDYIGISIAQLKAFEPEMNTKLAR
jgi:hypothetical protein